MSWVWPGTTHRSTTLLRHLVPQTANTCKRTTTLTAYVLTGSVLSRSKEPTSKRHQYRVSQCCQPEQPLSPATIAIYTSLYTSPLTVNVFQHALRLPVRSASCRPGGLSGGEECALFENIHCDSPT